MNTSDVLATFAYDAPKQEMFDASLYGPWFRFMVPMTNLSDEQVAHRDIGQLNLQCAFGLPGAEDLNLEAIEASVNKINNWAEQVRQFPRKFQYKFDRRPWEYDNSPGQFRMLCLATYLYEQIGLRFNPDRAGREFNASDSRNLFIHGLLSGTPVRVLTCCNSRSYGIVLLRVTF